MRKVLKVLFVVVLLLTLVSCNKKTPDAIWEGVRHIVDDNLYSNFYFFYDEITDYHGTTFDGAKEVYMVDFYYKRSYDLVPSWKNEKYVIILNDKNFVNYEKINLESK